MARQGEHKTVNYIGVDPGDRWCGWARLSTLGREMRTHCGVLDRNERTIYEVVEELLGTSSLIYTTVIVEEFKQRAVGHQTFNKGMTLRLMGALEYRCEHLNTPFFEEPAGDPDRQLNKLWDAEKRRPWMTAWDRPLNPNWHHGRSALRVMCRWMLSHDPQTLIDLKGCKMIKVDTDFSHGRVPTDLVSPLASWRKLTK